MADAAASMTPSEEPVPAAAAEPIEAPIDGSMDIPKEDENVAGPQATTEVNPPDGEGTTEVAEPPSAAADDGTDTTPASGKKGNKRNNGGVPEHKKNKNLNRKKSMPTLRPDCQPGEFYWARLKGYPPWPAVICDEQMLPESLLASRPVSTTRPDGSLRDDFKEGGKNAKERTFPIMFLSTNEFTWMVNTALTPLDPEDCKSPPPAKMTNALKKAWVIASEEHDLDYFKGILKTWQEEQAQIEKEIREQEEKEAADRERREAEEAEAAKNAPEDDGKAKKKKSRKSKGGDDDIEMNDADAPKSSKKRKNEGEDGGKPKKTPKITKLNAPKTPNGESSTKKSSAKSKKKIVQAPKADEEEEKPEMTEEERFKQREKAILYLRHRLQKGFLTRDAQPQEDEMANMADFFSQLEGYENLEPSIIRATKVHKVLKGIVKLASIPKDELYNFKKRSAALLDLWNKRMEAEGESAPAPAVEAKKEPETNGFKTGEGASQRIVPVREGEPEDGAETKEGAEQMDDTPAAEVKGEVAADKLDEKVETAAVEDKMDVVEPLPEEPAEKLAALGNDAKDEATDGDVKMQATVEDVAEAT